MLARFELAGDLPSSSRRHPPLAAAPCCLRAHFLAQFDVLGQPSTLSVGSVTSGVTDARRIARLLTPLIAALIGLGLEDEVLDRLGTTSQIGRPSVELREVGRIGRHRPAARLEVRPAVSGEPR